MHEIQVIFKKRNNGIWGERAKIYLHSKYVAPTPSHHSALFIT